MTKSTTPEIDWAGLKAKRAAAVETSLELQQSEQLIIAAAADYLNGPETLAFLQKLADFQAVSQLNSPFVQQLANTCNTIDYLRTHVTGAAQIIRADPAAGTVAAPVAVPVS